MKRTALVVGMLALLSACAKEEPMPKPKPLVAKFTATPVALDGNLDDAAWKKAEKYKLRLPADKAAEGKKLLEPGEVMLAWDDNFFYVAASLADSDVVAEGDEDQLHHYRMGDLIELFLKPDDQSWYWELYATPKGKKTSFWFPGRGRLGLESCYKYDCGLRVAARVDGTLNDWQDKDKGWTVEMAMPIADLTARGETFRPGSKWSILVARYNYSRYLPWVENSATSALSRTNYHLLEEYRPLKLVK